MDPNKDKPEIIQESLSVYYMVCKSDFEIFQSGFMDLVKQMSVSHQRALDQNDKIIKILQKLSDEFCRLRNAIAALRAESEHKYPIQ